MLTVSQVKGPQTVEPVGMANVTTKSGQEYGTRGTGHYNSHFLQKNARKLPIKLGTRVM